MIHKNESLQSPIVMSTGHMPGAAENGPNVHSSSLPAALGVAVTPPFGGPYWGVRGSGICPSSQRQFKRSQEIKSALRTASIPRPFSPLV